MDKLILLSIVFAMIAVPAATARMRSRGRGMIFNIFLMAIFVLLYALAVMFLAADLIDTEPPPGWSM